MSKVALKATKNFLSFEKVFFTNKADSSLKRSFRKELLFNSYENMAFLNFFTLVLIIYSVVFLLKCYNKLVFLDRFGIEISLFQIKWFTQRFNRFFLKCGNGYRKAIVIW